MSFDMFIAFLIMVIFNISDGIHAVRSSSLNNTFDYMMLVKAWPQTTCLTESSHKCVIPPSINEFIIHGNWPSRNDTTYPEMCAGAHFNSSEIYPIRKALDQYWPNCFVDESPNSFWSHEWRKHGTCAANVVPLLSNEFEYFNKTISLSITWSFLSALRASNIIPDSKKTYNMISISKAIVSYFGFTPVLFCDEYKSTVYLAQIGVCLNNKSLLPFECDPRVIASSSCRISDDIVFPPILH